MCENRPDAETRTPFLTAPQNTNEQPAAAEKPVEISAEPTPDRTAAAPEKTSFFACRAEKWALPAALWLGYFYCRMLFGANDYRWPFHLRIGGENGLWFYCMPLLVCLAFAVGVTALCRAQGLYLLRRKVTKNADVPPPACVAAESPFWLVCLLLTAAAMGFDRLNAVGWAFGWLALHAFAVLWLLARTGQLSENRTGPALAADVLRGLGWGFAGLAEWPKALMMLIAERPRRSKKRKNLLPAVLCVGGALILLFMAAKELARADDGFADRLQSVVDALVFWKDFSPDWSVVVSLIFAFPVGAYFYGMAAAGRRALAQKPRPAPAVYAQRLAPARQLSAGLLCGVLAAFAVLYLAFFAVQGGYLFGAFTHRLPRGFTVANYARQGFFELCRVMLLNFFVLLCADAFCRRPLRQCPGLRIAAAVLLVQSLLLWVTAASKLGLYIATFGFTAKRLLAAWALLVLAVAAVRYLASLWRRCGIVRPTVLVGAAAFALLCLY